MWYNGFLRWSAAASAVVVTVAAAVAEGAFGAAAAAGGAAGSAALAAGDGAGGTLAWLSPTSKEPSQTWLSWTRSLRERMMTTPLSRQYGA